MDIYHVNLLSDHIANFDTLSSKITNIPTRDYDKKDHTVRKLTQSLNFDIQRLKMEINQVNLLVDLDLNSEHILRSQWQGSYKNSFFAASLSQPKGKKCPSSGSTTIDDKIGAKQGNLSKNVPSTHLSQRFRSFTLKKEKNQEKTQKEKKAKNTKKEKKSRKNQRHDIFCGE